MADIPFDTYNVNLQNSSNNWANGALVYKSATDVKYKGNDVSATFNPDTTNVSWDVSLSHAGNNCSLSFTGGQYSTNPTSGKGQITGGTVSSSCLVMPKEDPTDGWSAD